MPCRAVYPEQKTIRTVGDHRVDPERGVLAVSDKPQLRINQGYAPSACPARCRNRAICWRFDSMAHPPRAGATPGRGTYDQGRTLGLPDAVNSAPIMSPGSAPSQSSSGRVVAQRSSGLNEAMPHRAMFGTSSSVHTCSPARRPGPAIAARAGEGSRQPGWQRPWATGWGQSFLRRFGHSAPFRPSQPCACWACLGSRLTSSSVRKYRPAVMPKTRPAAAK